MTSAIVRPEASATITVANPVVVSPAAVVYSQDFATNADSWSGGGYNVVTSFGRGGVPGAYSNIQSGSSPIEFQRVVSGLTVGRNYSFDAWLGTPRSSATTVLASLGVIGVGDNAYTTVPSAVSSVPVYAKHSYTFTATAASHTLRARSYSTVIANNSYLLLDDVSLTALAVTTLTPSLPITEGKITLADDWSPYVQATFDVPLTSVAIVEQINPTTTQRVTVTAADGASGGVRTFDLGLRARDVDHKAKTITMELASDEALLMDRKNVSAVVDSTPRTYENSLRAICNWALGKIGASLEAGTDDADLTAHWDAENMILNPRVTTIGDYTAFNSTVTYDTTFPGTQEGLGHNGVHIYNPTSGDSGMYISGDVGGMRLGMQAGKTYTFSASGSVRSLITGPVTDRQRRLVVHAWSAARGYTIWTSPAVPNTAMSGTNGTRVSVTFTVPPDATQVFIRAYHGGTGGAISWGLFRLSEGGPGTEADNSTYFWGSKPAGGGYTYSWASTADQSLSKRKATLERLPALFDWPPGQSLWSFLQPLLEASGLRLFCDEARKWRLVNPETHDVPGYVTVQEKYNATRGVDKITRNDDTWADAVVAVYEWDDADGNAQTAYDFAGSPTGKCVTVRYDREYPGSGAAAYALARLQGQGRTQEVTALSQYTATPGQDVTISLPGTLPQTGKVREVIFDLRTGLMDLGTRGLTDAYPGSWALWNPTQVWSAVNSTLKWKDA